MHVIIYNPRHDSLSSGFLRLKADLVRVESSNDPGPSVTLLLSGDKARAVSDALTGHGTLHRLLLNEIDSRLLQADPSPTGGLIYRRCHIARLPIGLPVGGWQWRHDDAEPGDARHGICGTVAGCLNEIDEMYARMQGANQ